MLTELTPFHHHTSAWFTYSRKLPGIVLDQKLRFGVCEGVKSAIKINWRRNTPLHMPFYLRLCACAWEPWRISSRRTAVLVPNAGIVAHTYSSIYIYLTLIGLASHGCSSRSSPLWLLCCWGIWAFVCAKAPWEQPKSPHELSKVRRARSWPLNHHGSGDPDSSLQTAQHR